MKADLEKVDFKANDPISAAALQAMRDEILRPSFKIRASGGINARRSANGDIQIAAVGDQQYPFLAKTTSTVTARSSAVLGVGSVEEWIEDESSGTANTFTATGNTYDDVLNLSSTTGGIPSGTWVAVGRLASGRLFMTTVDCGN